MSRSSPKAPKKRSRAPRAAEGLEGSALLSVLDAKSARGVLSRMSERSFPAGAAVFREGDPGEELFIVGSGRLAISVRPAGGGDEVVLSEIGRGGFFGEMAIIDHSPRSADCRALEDSVLLSLGSRDFDLLIEEMPAAAARVLESMLSIAAARLLKTGSFLSEMVRWGEAARARAVTDPMTGLFNRRYMEEGFEGVLARARVEGRRVSLAMFDMDHFGDLNKKHGQAVGDQAIVAGAEAMRAVFGEGDILVRYGGDEFVFLVMAGVEEGLARCEALCGEFRRLRLPGCPGLRLSCSVGVAGFPDDAASLEALKAAADKALYEAKEAGRDRAMAARPTIAKE